MVRLGSLPVEGSDVAEACSGSSVDVLNSVAIACVTGVDAAASPQRG